MYKNMWIVALLCLSACGEPIILSPDAVLPDGGKYQGELLEGKFHGHGSLVYPQGDYYKGEFKNGLFHGQGLWVEANGNRYEGQFKEGQTDGLITFKDPVNDLHYEGEMQDWYFNGQGKEFKGDTLVYEGEFKDGLYHGKGLYVQGENRYQGDFIKGELSGEGKVTDAQGSVYEGEVKGWMPNGQGVRTDSQGNVLKGTFANSFMEGEGEYLGIDGTHYKGNFQYGQYDGEGVLSKPDKTVYTGEFSYGQYHGNGILLTPAQADGEETVVEGKWNNGQLVYNQATGERQHAQAELALENHQRLLSEALQNIQASEQTQPSLYLLGVAGDGSQSVFKRELEYAQDQISKRYQTKVQAINLINHHDTASQYPLATRRSIADSIQAISDKMNRDKDVLFLFLTSHGSREHELYLNHDSIKLPPLSSDQLAKSLQESGIKWKVIIVSACYAGGFIPKLADEHTLIMTAADAKNTSFGCSEESEMTNFGKALFKEVLAQEPELGWVAAFERAKVLIERWEEEGELSASNPMISAPEAIIEYLAELR